MAWRRTDSARRCGVHAGAVVGHLDAVDAAAVERDGDAGGAGVERVLDQFLHRGGGAFDHLAGGDAVDGVGGEDADCGHAVSAWLSHEKKASPTRITRIKGTDYADSKFGALRAK